jgi:hypothetical protein
MKLLENPYLLKDPDKDSDPFLSDLTNLEPLALAKIESVQVLSTLFGDASNETMEEDPQMTMTTSEATDLLKEEDLPTKTPMATCRIMSPSPQPSKSELWDPYPGSSMGTEPELTPSLPDFWDT